MISFYRNFLTFSGKNCLNIFFLWLKITFLISRRTKHSGYRDLKFFFINYAGMCVVSFPGYSYSRLGYLGRKYGAGIRTNLHRNMRTGWRKSKYAKCSYQRGFSEIGNYKEVKWGLKYVCNFIDLNKLSISRNCTEAMQR